MDNRKKDLIDERSKTRLKKEAKKKIQTTMIGALSSIEKYFGFLWCDGCDYITPEQAKIKEIFEDMRTEILDKGNHQIRTMEAEIETYSVVWNKYHLNLPIRPLKDFIGGKLDD